MYSIILPNRRSRLVTVARLFLLGLSRREESPMSFVCMAFTRACSNTASSRASADYENVNAPLTHGAECRTRSPMCALCDVRIEKTTEPNVESESKPLFQFAGFRPFSAPKLSAHERISVASSRSACRCFGQSSQYRGERDRRHIRSLSQYFAHLITTPKSCTKPRCDTPRRNFRVVTRQLR